MRRILILTALLFVAACVRAQIVVSTGSEAVGIRFCATPGQCAWSVGNHTTAASLDVFDWGAGKANSLSAEVHAFIFPTPNVDFYGAALNYQPTMSWLGHTNVSPSQFQLFVQAGGGEMILPGLTKPTFFGGGGGKYRANANLTWNVLDGYVLCGNGQCSPTVSMGIIYTINPAQSQNAAVKATLHKAATKVWGQ